MVERRRQQRMLWEGWFPEEAAGWVGALDEAR
jgi:hypothetical protein